MGQLHLEDLEPHRFEDLVRQLLYDFRPWRQLEATGRSGGDAGFDARGYEVVQGVPGHEFDDEAEEDDDVEADTKLEPAEADRLWLIQCKRERSIGPTKARRYVRDLASTAMATNPWGLLLAASCDLSKAARDAIRTEARALGFAEIHVWAKGELEDELYQPKNDHLLFAYAGFSLRMRTRSLRSDLRARLATKRKLKRALGGARLLGSILVREASDGRYPYMSGVEADDPRDRRHWTLYSPESCRWDGLRITHRRCFAFVDADGNWDVMAAVDLERTNGFTNPWSTEEDDIGLRSRAEDAWRALPEHQRAFFVEERVISYDSILDIDQDGDDWFHGVHVYVADFDPVNGPLLPGAYFRLKLVDRFREEVAVDRAKRVRTFPDDLRTPDIPQERTESM
jgi:hypothetical protein